MLLRKSSLRLLEIPGKKLGAQLLVIWTKVGYCGHNKESCPVLEKTEVSSSLVPSSPEKKIPEKADPYAL